MTARLALTAQAEDLIDAYAAELAAAGPTAWPSDVGGARLSCARYPFAGNVFLLDRSRNRSAFPVIIGGSRADGHRQDERRRSSWPGPTCGWVSPPPATTRRCAPTSAIPPDSGLRSPGVLAQWSVLAQLAALHGVRPAQVTAEQLDTGGDALLPRSPDPTIRRPGDDYAHPWFDCAPRSFMPG